jgi:glycosyltransferase involved in cell wall biosynthesis
VKIALAESLSCDTLRHEAWILEVVLSDAAARLQRIAFLGCYEPRQCGIATFTHDLCEAVDAITPAQTMALAVNDSEDGYDYPPRVCLELQQGNLQSYRHAADYLNFNNADVLSVQHEFGIFGGHAGSHLFALLKEVRMPVVTTLHTVLQNPDAAHRKVMEELTRRSDRLVVMAQKGAAILREVYAVPDEKIDIIAHGIPDIPFTDSNLSKAQFGVEGRPVLLTFGLLGPGKGIEYAIRALPAIVEAHPDVVYLVLGATHPHLVAREGEQYRMGLERLAEELNVKEHVIFYNRFVSLEDLTEFITATDVYVTPYLNEAQITSGTLAYVFGAGKAVVSTPYWHATELLAEGRGMLVPFRDPPAIAEAVCKYLGSAGQMDSTRRDAYRLGREMVWPAVAQRYIESFQRARADRRVQPRTAFANWTLASRPYKLPDVRLDHLVRMSDDTGIFQHALYNVPDFHHGYCTDDNARAFILCNLLDDPGGKTGRREIDLLTTRYLAFLTAALNRDSGRFRNFMNYERKWLEESGSEDSHGRALWALGNGTARCRDLKHRRLCAKLFEAGLPAVAAFTSPRAWAFTLLGIHEFLREVPDLAEAKTMRSHLTQLLLGLWCDSSSANWLWFESCVTYDNARLCQALILSGRDMEDPETLEVGLLSLRWLISLQRTQAGNFRPIGSNGFYVKDGVRADFDQQPVEAQAMVSACLEAFRVTGDDVWLASARRTFEWFLGRNDLNLSLYDPASGGCGDGLHPDRVNENQGAESTLAFHLALAELNDAERLLVHPLSSSS